MLNLTQRSLRQHSVLTQHYVGKCSTWLSAVSDNTQRWLSPMRDSVQLQLDTALYETSLSFTQHYPVQCSTWFKGTVSRDLLSLFFMILTNLGYLFIWFEHMVLILRLYSVVYVFLKMFFLQFMKFLTLFFHHFNSIGPKIDFY